MRRMSRLACVLAVFALLALPGAPSAKASERASVDDVLLMAQGYLSSVWAVRYSFHMTSHAVADPDSSPVERTVDWAYDWQGREFSASHLPSYAEGDREGWSGELWDGEQFRQLSVLSAEQPPHGTIAASRPRQSTAYNPAEMCLRFTGQDTREKIVSLNSTLVRTEATSDDVRYVVEFELQPATADSPGISTEVTFSQRRNYAPVQIVVMLGQTVLRDIQLELAEVRPGIWLPVSSVTRSWPEPGAATEEAYRLGTVTDTRVDVDSYKVNEEVTDEDFQLAFPPGTYVMDQVTGTQYYEGEAADGERLDGLIAASREVLGQAGDETAGIAGSLRSAAWPLGGIAFSLALCALLVTRRAHSRQAAAQAASATAPRAGR